MTTLAEALQDAIQELFLPIIAATRFDSAWRGLLYSLGHTEQVASDPGLRSALEQTATVVEGAAGLDPETLLSWDGLMQVLQIGSDANDAVRAFQQAASDPALADRIADLGEELMEQLVAQYLRNNHQVLFRVSSALTIITPAEFVPVEPVQSTDSAIIRLPWQQNRFQFDRIQGLVSDPLEMLLESYFPNNLAQAADAHQAAALLFPQLGALADALHVWWRSDLVAATPEPLPDPPPPDDPGLTLDHFAGDDETEPDVDVPVPPPPDLAAYYPSVIPRFLFAVPRADGGGDPHFAIALLNSSAQHPHGIAGLIVTPIGSFNSTELRGSWGITVTSNGQLAAFVIGPGGFSLAPSSSLTGGSVQVLLERIPESGTSGPAFLFGSAHGSRLELGTLRFEVDLSYDDQRMNASIGLAATSGALVLAPGDGDTFLAAVLPAQGMRADFNLSLGWSNEKGLTLSGGAGLDANLPVGISIGDIALSSVHLSLQTSDTGLVGEASASITASLGPLTVVIDGIGIASALTFPQSGGNLGISNLDIRFKPPDGLGLSIKGEGFSGGGFLRYIEADQHYEGMLDLEYEDKISLKAIGLLTTRLPGGQPGYSLLIIITSEFTPIELGLGFTLNGVGGLLGLNRTANVERLRSGLRDATLSSVLFPQNVIENASRILSDLNQVFPAQADRFIFGPMARIGWGTPTLITIDLGLLIEIPDPVRVLILGVVKASLPDEKARLLELQVNFLGVIDFDAHWFSFDASLYNSKLLTYPLTGDMAVRLIWGDEPNSLLTVGGFHPAYQPPPLNLPSLRRLSMHLTSGNNPRITLETYFAITSNTVQFGAKAELYAEAGSFNIYGYLSYDVLFQFNPFYFIAAISAKLALRSGSSEIASISLDLTLEGPTPWHAKGTAKLKICWFLTIKVHFDKTFGEARNTRLDDIAVLPLLEAALSDQGNWEAHAPDNRRLLVSFKQVQTDGKQVLVYPFGILTIQQKVVPLKIQIQRFGSQRPADGNRFAIGQILAGEVGDSDTLTTDDVREMFAPAQFFDMSDAQKLASKSFERYDSGVKLVDSEAFDGDYAVRREVAYELSYIDEQRNIRPRPDLLLPDLLAFQSWAVRGAVANSPLSHARNGRSALAPGAVQVSQETYAVVNTSDLRLVEASTTSPSQAGAQRLMAEMIRNNPALEGELLVVPSFEVNRS